MVSASSASDGFHVGFGIGLVSTQAFDAGIVSLPSPLTESFWPGWLYHNFFDLRMISATEGDGVNAVAGVVRIDVDSKAMRKWGANETVVAVMEQVEIGASAVASVFFDSRVLVKLA